MLIKIRKVIGQAAVQNPRLPRKHVGGIILAQVLIALSICSSNAFSANRIQLNAPAGKVSKSGLTVQISSLGIAKTGYRRINVTVNSRTAVKADRVVAVNMVPNEGYSRGSKKTTVRCVVKIPQGSASATESVLVTQSGYWSSMEVEVFDEGELVRDMSGHQGLAYSGMTSSNFTESYPGWLFIDRHMDETKRFGGTQKKATYDLPNIRRLAWFFPQYSTFQTDLIKKIGNEERPTDLETYTMLRNLDTVNMLSPANSMSDWLEYTPYDIVVVSFEDLNLLRQDHPEKWAALDQFVRSGGNLIVYDLSNENSSRAGLNAMFGFVDDAWTAPSDDDYGESIKNMVPEIRYYQTGQRVNLSEEMDLGTSENATKNKIPAPMFQLRDYHFGSIVAINDEDPFAADTKQWTWIISSLGSNRYKWYQRHGMSLGRDNNDFWNLMIPGVGAAPVTAFLVLISVFVLAIGPINYFFLNRVHRLYLLLFTVPVGALLVTVSLLLYAFLGDGLGTRVRYRSFTELIDGQAISWSRQTYYAGMPNSEGLVFPSAAAVYPVQYDQQSGQKRRTLLWEEDRQHLYRGYLQARSMSQFLVVNPVKASKQVKVLASNAGELKVENQFGVELDGVVAYEHETQSYYWADRVGDGKTVELKNLGKEGALKNISSWLEESRLTIPEGFNFTKRRNYRYYYGNALDPGESLPLTNTALLEQQIGALRFSRAPKRNVFFALTRRRPPTVPQAIRSASEEASFHVVKGTW